METAIEAHSPPAATVQELVTLGAPGVWLPAPKGLPARPQSLTWPAPVVTAEVPDLTPTTLKTSSLAAETIVTLGVVLLPSAVLVLENGVTWSTPE